MAADITMAEKGQGPVNLICMMPRECQPRKRRSTKPGDTSNPFPAFTLWAFSVQHEGCAPTRLPSVVVPRYFAYVHFNPGPSVLRPFLCRHHRVRGRGYELVC